MIIFILCLLTLLLKKLIDISNISFWGIEGERYLPEQEISQKMLDAVNVVATDLQTQVLQILQK